MQKSFAKDSTLKRHIKEYHTLIEKTMKCPHCDKIYPKSRKSELNNHIKTKHDESKLIYSCTICRENGKEKKIALADRLKRHKKDTHGPRKRCDMCDKTFQSKGTLKRHVANSHS